MIGYGPMITDNCPKNIHFIKNECENIRTADNFRYSVAYSSRALVFINRRRFFHEQLNRGKSLQELDGENWGGPEIDSFLVKECHRLRRTPLGEFTPGDLRIMIGQNIGLQYLIPLAIEYLQKDPLVEGDYFPGDLLSVVLRAESDFFVTCPHYRQEVERIVSQALLSLSKMDVVDRGCSEKTIMEAFNSFNKDKI